jgi:TatD DNase family protein
MNIIDTHSHIYLEQFDKDRDEMIQRALEAGVKSILMPNIDVESIGTMMKVKAQYSKHCKAMMGLHPTSVKEDYQKQLDVMRQWFQKDEFCAVGEIGIDLYWDKTFLKEQEEVFKIQLNWAKELGLPVVIHAREAFDEIFRIMDHIDLTDVQGVFHSFSGDGAQAKKALSYKGFKLGINGVVTFKNSGLDKVVQQLSLNDLVLETDAPYLTPTPFRGKRNEPAYLSYVVKKMSDIYGTSSDEVISQTTKNASEIFRID